MKNTDLILLVVLLTGSSAKSAKDLLPDDKDLQSPAVERIGDLGGVKLPAVPDVNPVMSFPGGAPGVVPPEEVCYDDLPCFSMRSPWYSAIRPLPTPISPDLIQTRFYLYTRKQPKRFFLSTGDTKFNAKGSDFKGSRQTFFITHGFTSTGNETWLNDMKDAILKRFDANVILVDWGKGAANTNYFQVASNTRVVGATLVKLGKYLIANQKAAKSRFNVIGHSLGAQISAYMCKGLPGVARLYALDPAQPAFEGYVKTVRLDKSDAKFVEVLHTSSRLFIPLLGLGMIKAYGHVDYYMNGGWEQPGCIEPPKPNITSFEDLGKVPVEDLANFIACPHGRSYLFLTASIRYDNCTFWGHRANDAQILASIVSEDGLIKIPQKKCDAKDNCVPLGVEAIKYPARGSFVVKTTAQEPYCIPEPESDKKMKRYRSKN